MKQLVMATNNEHKLREIRQILGSEYQVLGLTDIGCHEDIPETCLTLEGNALQKAHFVADRYGVDPRVETPGYPCSTPLGLYRNSLFIFADDTGLEVDALGGEPGVFTARYGSLNGYGSAHDSDANIRCLLDKLRGVSDRTARFRTVIALIQGGEDYVHSVSCPSPKPSPRRGLSRFAPIFFEGVVEGRITSELRGTDGFGYDPVFEPSGTGLTFAEMGPEEKNRISHRALAVRKLIEYLQAQ